MFTAAGKSAAASSAVYIEEVFSTFLYTGNGSTQTITNGIDLSGKGGLVWLKQRTGAGLQHVLYDTVRGGSSALFTSLDNAAITGNASYATTFTATGFSTNTSGGNVNNSSATNVSWTFREQAKFFDVVTYTGNGSNRTIAHNLGSTPGFLVVKRTDAANEWYCYHRAFAADNVVYLNQSNALTPQADIWNSTAPTSTVFSVGTNAGVNASGGTYVAYIFAHNAGGFGLTGTDNVITCGSYTGNGSATGPSVTLGYEPQWILVKGLNINSWSMFDVMRGMPVGTGDLVLRANLSSAESDVGDQLAPTATGFNITSSNGAVNTSSQTYIYIAIRRGPMKTPTSGTSVFSSQTTTATGSLTSLAAPDTVISRITGSSNPDWNSAFFDRLRGNGAYLVTSAVVAEQTLSTALEFNSSQFASQGISSSAMVYYLFKRAPSFFDVVCYTGTGSGVTQTVSHNLTVAPEMIIVMARSAASDRVVWQSSFSILNRLRLNTTQAVDVNNTQHFGGTLPTSSVFYVGSTNNDPGTTYVAYLFATLAGVTKVGSYTGTGALQTINCGFAAGAKFVLIKRTDSTGDWWVYDSARGITSSDDPYFFFNTTAAQVTNTNYVDTTSVGFQVTAAAPAGLNANGGTYIFLAIA